MRDSWTGAQELFDTWPLVPPTSEDTEYRGTLRRLKDTLEGLMERRSSWRDVAALTRQILLEAQAHGNNFGLEVPLGAPLPTRLQWEQLHCHALPAGRRVLVTARPWHPDVSDQKATEASEHDFQQIHHGESLHRHLALEPCPADPFWIQALGEDYAEYKSIGQRQAARAVALAEPGSTVIACLPTGHGKTALVQAPALLSSKRSGVTLVVVPTVVLALDMERRAQELLSARGRQSPTGRYAYIGNLDENLKQQLREDIRSGSQRLVFTNPESLVSGLKSALEDAAEAGHLQYFVVDEAHLVEQWGEGFRPEFQTMSVHRRTWLSTAPAGREPVTVCMSATLTEQQVTTLEKLFSGPKAAEIVWGAQLRHEPSYYIDDFAEEEKRTEAVLRAVDRLPKPLALYVTERKDARAWADRLRTAGYRRVADVAGYSSPDERRQAVEGWGGRSALGPIPTQYDIVVGTSAFGLGVDLSDVRSVVHACLPETVDRYYQEVGRTGRDGSPSVAYLASAPRDLPVAEGINRQAIIRADTAWSRWRWMWDVRDKTYARPRHYLVNLDSIPDNVHDISEANRDWNIRTLNLMLRAGLIELHVPEPPKRSGGEPRAVFQERLNHFYELASTHVDVSIADTQTNDEGHFQARFEAERRRSITAQRNALADLRTLLRGDRCTGEVLSTYYRVQRGAAALMSGINCRGCPNCRSTGLPADNGFYKLAGDPHPLVPAPTRAGRDPLRSMRGTAPCLSLWWGTESERQVHVPRLLEMLALRGMNVIGGPGITSRLAEALQKDVAPRPIICDTDADLLRFYDGPIVWVLDDDPSSVDSVLRSRLGSPDVTYLIHPRSTPHPDRPDLSFTAFHRQSFPVRNALESF
ncbi:protein DpdF [Streptomyces sp. NBC_00996]|uniref:protein DpdF n=1 Tax=Streptomyces sp. NBC_00996 TaxID=2903710 RepID=UPI0038647A30|nr:protein DpdF [Streptomyces sp. NBC_00996]